MRAKRLTLSGRAWLLGGRLQPEQTAVLPLDEPWALRELSLVVRQDARFPDFITEFMNFLLEDPQVAMTRAPL